MLVYIWWFLCWYRWLSIQKSWYFFSFWGRDEGTPSTQGLFKFHHTNQENTYLKYGCIKYTKYKNHSKEATVFPPTPPPNTVALHYSTKQWFGWLFLKFSLCSLAFGKMNNRHQYLKNICKLREFTHCFSSFQKDLKWVDFCGVWYVWFPSFSYV